MDGLNAWCKVTVLRLKSCGLGEGGGRALETLRLNTTISSLDLRGGRRAGAGRGTARQHHDCVARPLLQRPGRWRRAGADRGPATEHQAHVVRPWRQWPDGGRRAGAGRGTAPQHHGYVVRPQRQWHERGSTVCTWSGLGRQGRGIWGLGLFLQKVNCTHTYIHTYIHLHTHTHTHAHTQYALVI